MIIRSGRLAGLCSFPLLSIFTTSALGWGYDEHRMTGLIAEHYLSDASRERIARLLGIDPALSGEAMQAALSLAMSEASVWADDIKKTDPTYDWAKPLHYVNMPPGATDYVPHRDCGDNVCVVAAISYYADILRLPGAPAPAQVEALRFLIHFVGDVHQPLHAGNSVDLGGNRITLQFNGEETNLHALWDYGMTSSGRKESGESWQQGAARLIDTLCDRPVDSSDGVAGGELRSQAWAGSLDPAHWAVESRNLALSNAYGPIFAGNTETVGADYVQANLPVAEERIAAAGVRMAALLNTIFGGAASPDLAG